MRDKLKFKKLLNEFRSLKFEGEYIEDVLLEAHEDFESYYNKFCEDKGISIKDLEDKNKDDNIYKKRSKNIYI